MVAALTNEIDIRSAGHLLDLQVDTRDAHLRLDGFGNLRRTGRGRSPGPASGAGRPSGECRLIRVSSPRRRGSDLLARRRV